MEFVALSTPVLIAIGLIVFGAATVKGVAGLGFPLITVPLVANIVGPHAAVVIIAGPTVASNLFMVAHGGGTVARLRQLAWLIAGLVAGAAVSARLLRGIKPAGVGLVLGVLARRSAWASGRPPGCWAVRRRSTPLWWQPMWTACGWPRTSSSSGSRRCFSSGRRSRC